MSGRRARLDFAGFNGTTVLASSHVRKCEKCKRMIGRGRGYSYGYGKRVDVCPRCHKRNFRRARHDTGEMR